MIEQTQFFDPEEEIKAKADIERRRAYAQSLRDSAKPTGNEMVSGVVVKKSPLEGLAKMLQSGMAGYNDYKATEAETQNKTNQQKLLAEALGQYGEDPNAAAQMLMQSPEYSGMGAQLMTGNADRERAYQDKLNFMKESAPYELDKARNIAQIKSNYGGNKTSVLQNADAYLDAIKSGDFDRANAISEFGKTQDKGIQRDESGGFVPLQGYGGALGDIGQEKKFGETTGKNLSDLQYKPQIERLTSEQGVVGKSSGEAINSALDAESSLPRLEDVVRQLSDLGKGATYTLAGQAADATKRQLGLPVGNAAIARREYIAKVDNEVLPLLRQTFGSAFTQKEGESLKDTLGDVNASPEEKDAVLRSFIDSKREQMNTLNRRAGLQNQSQIQNINSATQGQSDKPISEMTIEELKAIAGGQ